MPDENQRAVFLSYAREDRLFVGELARAIEEMGFSAWVDTEDLRAGVEWQPEIDRAIERAVAFLFVLSDMSLKSAACRGELASAVRLGKRIIPIARLGQSDPLDLPDGLAKPQWLWVDSASVTEGLQQLSEALQEHRDWLEWHGSLTERAAQWRRAGADAALLSRGSELQRSIGWLMEAPQVTTASVSSLQRDFITASQQHEKEELERIRGLFREATANRLTAQSQALRVLQPRMLDRAALLALESLRLLPSAEGYLAARRALGGLAVSQLRARGAAGMRSVTFCDNGRTLIWIGEDSEVFARRAGVSDRLVAGPASMVVGAPWADSVIVGGTGGMLTLVTTAPSGLRELGPIEGFVRDAAFSRDATRWVVTSTDGCRFWAGEAEPWFVPSPADLWCAALSDDGELAAAGSETGEIWLLSRRDRSVRQWAAHERHRVSKSLRIGMSDATISSIAFSRDGARLVTTGFDGTCRVWDVEQRRQLHCLRHLEDVPSARIADDGRRVVTACMDGAARIWELPDGSVGAELWHHRDVLAIAASPDFSRILTASGDHTARLWDGSTGREVARACHTDTVCAVAGDGAMAQFASAGGGEVQAWTEPPPLDTRLVNGLAVASILASPAAGTVAVRLATDSEDTVIRVFDLETGRADEITIPDFGAAHLWSADGALLVTANWPGELCAWEWRAGRLAWARGVGTRLIALVAHGERLMFSAFDVCGIHVVGLRDGSGDVVIATTHRARQISSCLESDQIAFTTDDGSGVVWAVEEDRQVGAYHHAGWNCATLLERGGQRRLWTTGADGAIVVRRRDGGALAQAQLEYAADELVHLPETDSLLVRSTLLKHVPYVIDLDASTLRERGRCHHDGRVMSYAPAPNGQLWCSSAEDGSLRVWDAHTMKEVARVEDLPSNPGFSWLHDGTRLIFSTREHALLVADVRSERLQTVGSARVGRGLTPPERRQYLGNEDLLR